MEAVRSFGKWFWNSDIWLMPGVSWQDLAPTPENGLPNPDDLLPVMIVMTGCFLFLRYVVFEPLIVKPIGRALGLRDQSAKKPPYQRELERIFQRYGKNQCPQSEVTKVAKEIGWSERQVERWFRYRTHSERPTKMFKLCDCSWNLLYYLVFCVLGFCVLYNKPWLWDIKYCWIGYPFHPLTSDVWWYYMIALGYYTTMSLSFMFQHRRKDSVQMLLHHLVTICLIVLSFNVNMIRMGCLILFVHECADIPLLVAKICGYAGYPGAMDFLFVVFILLWTGTRLYLYPFWIMKTALFEAHVILNTMAPIYYIFNGLLILLLLFHLIWTFFIVQIIVKKLRTRETKDLRSDDDELSEEFEEETPTQHNKKEKES